MAVISHRDRRFKKLFAMLPAHIQALAVKNYSLWRDNPWHPSLNFEELEPGRWSVRIGRDYRALGKKQADGVIVWTWIGSHESYNKLIRQ